MSNDTIAPSDLYQAIFTFKGAPLSYEFYPFWIDILNSERLSQEVDMSERKMVFKCSRQVAKSTNIGIMSAGMSLRNKNFKIIVTQPTDTQISRFSVDTLKKLNTDSIITREWYYDPKTTERQVKNMSYTTGSRIILANIYASVLSARGISGDMAIFDEYQDIPVDNAIVVQHATDRSPYRYIIYSGTPKTTDNDLEQKWQQSTMNEWVVPCRHCGHDNGPLGGDGKNGVVKHIGEKGLICEECHHRIYAMDGRWVMFNPPDEKNPRYIEGYHINELMIPPNSPGATSWKEIKRKIKEEPKVLIMNELLGLSYSDSTQPITIEAVTACCGDYEYVKNIEDAYVPDGWYAFGGLDWAMETAAGRGAVTTIRSYTILSIALFNPATGELRVDMVKKYYDTEENSNPEFVVSDIINWCEAYNVLLLGADYGVGNKENQRIAAALGVDRVMNFQYLGGPLQSFYTYDVATGHWIIGRTKAMEDLIDAINNKVFTFARYKGETSEHAPDLYTIYRNNNKDTRVTKYSHTKPDDWAHNLIYILLAKMYAFEEMDFTAKNDTTGGINDRNRRR